MGLGYRYTLLVIANACCKISSFFGYIVAFITKTGFLLI